MSTGSHKIAYAMNKRRLGCINWSSLDEYRSELPLYTTVKSVVDLKDTAKGFAWIAGLIYDVAFWERIVVKLDDGKGRIEMSCYGENF